MKRACPAVFILLTAPALAQSSVSIASVATDGVTLAAPLSVANGRATIGNNGTVTAGDKTAEVTLARGGILRLCATTALHMAMDRSVVEKAGEKAGAETVAAGLMLSLDRGAFEATYTPGQYSDVILTPDLRILVSGPGPADLKLRVNRQGDTCIDNRAGSDGEAPYITVSSMMEGGLYRVRGGQRVLFEHGSLQQVVDNEPESCGCPAAAPTVEAEAGAKPGGPSSTPADTAFPVAVSEGLTPAAAAAPATPIVPPGQAHAQVSASLGYEAGQPLPPPPPAAAPAPVAAAPPSPKRNLFGRIGHFFSRIFGS